MKYIDLHCDSLMEGYFSKQENIYTLPSAMLDIQKLQQGKCLAQFFAIFLPCDDIWEWYKATPVSDDVYFSSCVDIFNTTMKKNSDIIAPAYSYEQLLENEKQNKMSALLTIEDGRIINNDITKLSEVYQQGVRLITLTWNFANCFGSPNSRDSSVMNMGLTHFGKEAVERMNQLGMIVDVSHLSDGGFWDVQKISKKPFIASHSNCRALCNHPRNLTDEMIRALADQGGIIGVNFAPAFLDDTPGNEESRVKSMSAHVQHMIKIGGSDCISIGTDFDGIEGNLEIEGPHQMQKLFQQLELDGLTSLELEKISSLNAKRVLKDIL